MGSELLEPTRSSRRGSQAIQVEVPALPAQVTSIIAVRARTNQELLRSALRQDLAMSYVPLAQLNSSRIDRMTLLTWTARFAVCRRGKQFFALGIRPSARSQFQRQFPINTNGAQ